MANTKSAAKRTLQSRRRQLRNRSVISALKTTQKKLRVAIQSGNSEEVKTRYSLLTSQLDKAAKRGVIHSNAANRHKTRFARLVFQKAAA